MGANECGSVVDEGACKTCGSVSECMRVYASVCECMQVYGIFRECTGVYRSILEYYDFLILRAKPAHKPKHITI